METVTKCPACPTHHAHPRTGLGFTVKGGVPKRCPVCVGWGLATEKAIAAWELSL